MSVGKRFTRRGESKRNRARYVFAIFWIELGFPVEGRNLSGDLNRKTRGVEGLNSAYTALAGDECVPKGFAPNSERGHTPHSGDNNPAWTREPSQHSANLGV